MSPVACLMAAKTSATQTDLRATIKSIVLDNTIRCQSFQQKLIRYVLLIISCRPQ